LFISNKEYSNSTFGMFTSSERWLVRFIINFSLSFAIYFRHFGSD
jgi:hypothetical protein